MLFHVLIVVFILVCVLLTLFILVQSDKGGGISGAVGGGISNANSAIGAQNTENILTRGTTTLAVIYFSLAIVLFLLAAGKFDKKDNSIMGGDRTEITSGEENTGNAGEVAPVDVKPVDPAVTTTPEVKVQPITDVKPETGASTEGE